METNFGEIFFKIILTVLLCGLIGGERELRNKGAGLRTHILVGVGSTLIALTSFFILETHRDITVIDPTRIISGIVTGVGFLCAGTIIRGGDHIIGLTTAATLWVVSGIGMAVGVGQYFAATAVTLTVFLVLIGVKSIERKLKNKLSA